MFITRDSKPEKNNLAIKVNRLKGKKVRFESHKEFLFCCIADGLVPKGFELMLALTIRNHDQHFLDNHYLKLKQFSFSLIKGMVQCCDKTIDATATEISTTRTLLKSNTNQKQFKRIESKIKNEAPARKVLQQWKFKKFNTLKYKLNATTQLLAQKEDRIREKPRDPFYSDILNVRKATPVWRERQAEVTQ